ncbi:MULTISPECIES: hypothetical protein [unclassified Breznakia]|uniref:hypothetical protein n=1 Tax=unclassified Breznakia TaxID=2623764 RepID=UPI002474B6AA|nr:MULTISPECIES: hypothetical protein [unclassified Breznakia]MDH6367389.1 hypothetical protein [Breznakia sp. PH1-1]MDH6403921.1 hypothetical protein [Breznakia sp. PF1-11]MDH6411630.1 hypothetical protein [Breznakia sp. PFB1-11]MDH6414556.1 hypothetical protein [Breznakia sp. PFB1-14]MDH6418662.1 hypothetical protein [Breznakia sp. PFB1-12]
MGFKISKKLIKTNEDGTFLTKHITGKNENVIELVEVVLPSKVTFDGFEDVNGQPIYGVERASFFVKPDVIMEDKFDKDKYFINVGKGYVFPSVSIDLGKTGRILENGANEHNFTKLVNVPVEVIENSLPHKQWLTFTISKGMKGKTYKNGRDELRCQVFIPEGRGVYSGCKFTISPKHIKEVEGHDNLYVVSIHRAAEFVITKSSVVSADFATGEKQYETKAFPQKISAEELAKYFEKPKKQEQFEERLKENE